MAKKTAKKPSRVKAAKPAKRPTKKAAKLRSPVKPAKPRKLPRQAQIPGTEDPNADKKLDDLVHETYELTATWQAAKPPMTKSRDALLQRMKEKGISVYVTHQDMTVKLRHAKDSITISAKDDRADVELDAD
jgi:hypothetical protein